MLNLSFARIADYCIRNAWLIIILMTVLAIGSASYAVRHFAINTDVSSLLSPNLPWRQRELAYRQAFPQEAESILAVVNAPTSELADAATKALIDQLSPQTALFRSVYAAGGGQFFERNGLLYRSRSDLERTMRELSEGAPFIQILANDPTLRGLSHALSLALGGVGAGRYSLDAMALPLNTVAGTLENILSGKTATFSWRALVSGASDSPEDLRRLINIWPILDYRQLEPGEVPTAAIRQAAEDAKLNSRFDATVRLTGPVPIADQEFATLREGALLNGAITGAIILVILWLALRSLRIVAAVVVTILVGLVTTAALGLMLVGALNPISVAFAILFVGLGADFAIQYSVRYRAERHKHDDLRQSLTAAAKSVGAPLTLAAGSAAAGFLSFLPTSYRGVAELGLIAGCGMVVAYIASLTLLPALLWLFSPPREPKPLGYVALAPADRFLQRHRMQVVMGTSLVVLAGLPLLLHLRFDFNPISLQNPRAEAIATLRMLSSDPMIDVNAAQVIMPPSAEQSVEKKLSSLPQVARTRSLDSFVPNNQQEKRKVIENASLVLDPVLKATGRTTATDMEDIAALKNAAKSLQDAAGEASGPGPDAARRLYRDLNELANGNAELRRKAEAAFITPLSIDLQRLRSSLHPQHVTKSDLPGDLVRDWTSPDGRIRMEVAPRGDPNNSETLRQFAHAVLTVQPNATGEAIEIDEWGNTIITAFTQAGLWALCAITILLWAVLRRIGDVLLTIIPLLVAATATLEVCALTGFSLNYANIIALPVLLGIGVAFKIYYVMAWRGGETNFLQSPLTRAVFFSALMTATAFGSLWFSSHPGTSSMGKLLALSLVCTLASAALFQPALMGRPREPKLIRQPEI